MKEKLLILLSISGFIIALDQATKLYIHTHFQLGESLTVISNYFNITYVKNPGAAFGFLANSHPMFRDAFFLIIPPVAMVIIVMILRTVSSTDRIQILALSSVFGGAIGNYIDRLRLRYVIDFLDFHFQNVYSWPAFNVADISIVTGISLLFLLSFRKQPKPATET
jgi:signal peptidase II